MGRAKWWIAGLGEELLSGVAVRIGEAGVFESEWVEHGRLAVDYVD